MTPRDWDLLTVEETDHLLHWLDSYLEQVDKAAQQAKRR
jgi:TorA maturation chaperone TorD